MKAAIRLLCLLLATWTLPTSTPLAFGQQPSLTEFVDQRLAPINGLEIALCSDAEFIRRVSLDLTGMPPTADEARAFIADGSPDKRVSLVDRLLASPHYARHLASMLDLMLMERRTHTHISADEWQAWLVKSVRENKPWDQLVRELLTTDGVDAATRPAARFLLDRGVEPNLLTRDVGRILFGRDLQCAQCHDHPLVADYLQADYHGLLAYLSPTHAQVLKEGDKERTVLGEKAGTDLGFESVFIEGTLHRTGPRLPDGVALLEPFLLPGEEYVTPPADNVKAVPKFSRRERLAELATSGDNRAFNENIANRLWACLFGRGLVHPLDWHHPDNPASDAALLAGLADQLVALDFDMRAFLRALALSRAYQRSFDAPADIHQVADDAGQQLPALEQQVTQEQQQAERSQAAYQDAIEAWYAAEAAGLAAAGEVDAARTAYAEVRKKLNEAHAALATAQSQLQARQQVQQAVQAAATAAQQALQAVGEDGELSAATQKFVAKGELLNGEVAALQTAADEKQAAVQTATTAVEPALATLTAAQAKWEPLQEAFHAAEETMLTARQQAARDAQTLGSSRAKLATVEQIAQLPELQQAIETAQQQVASRTDEATRLAADLEALTPEIAAAKTAVANAENLLQSARLAVVDAQAAHAERTTASEAIAAAATAAATAQQLVGSDEVLQEVAGKLQERAAAAASATAETAQLVQVATAAEQTAAAALAQQQQSLSGVEQQRHQAVAAAAAAREKVDQAEQQLAECIAAREAAEVALTETGPVISRWRL